MAKVESHKVIDGHYSGVLKSVVAVRVEHLSKRRLFLLDITKQHSSQVLLTA